MRGAPVRVVWLVCAALAAAACTGDALAGQGSQPASSRPIPSTQTPPVATPVPSPQPTEATPAALARQAYDFVLSMQAEALKNSDATLRPVVCSATFDELELAARQPEAYQAQPLLADFLAAAGSISWACEMRQVAGVRAGVNRLSQMSSALAALAG